MFIRIFTHVCPPFELADRIHGLFKKKRGGRHKLLSEILVFLGASVTQVLRLHSSLNPSCARLVTSWTQTTTGVWWHNAGPAVSQAIVRSSTFSLNIHDGVHLHKVCTHTNVSACEEHIKIFHIREYKMSHSNKATTANIFKCLY